MRLIAPVKRENVDDMIAYLTDRGFNYILLPEELDYTDEFLKKFPDSTEIFAWKDEVSMDDDAMAHLKAGMLNLDLDFADVRGLMQWNRPISSIKSLSAYTFRGTTIPLRVWYHLGRNFDYVTKKGDFAVEWDGAVSLGHKFPAFLHPLNEAVDRFFISKIGGLVNPREFKEKIHLFLRDKLDGIKLPSNKCEGSFVLGKIKIFFDCYQMFEVRTLTPIGVKISLKEMIK